MLGIGRFRKAGEPATKLKFNPAASAKHDPTRLWIHPAASGNSTRSDPPKLNPPSSHVSRSTSKALCICQGIFMNPNKLSWRPAKTDGRRSDHNCVRSLLNSLTVQLSMNLSELTPKKKEEKQEDESKNETKSAPFATNNGWWECHNLYFSTWAAGNQCKVVVIFKCCCEWSSSFVENLIFLPY